MRKLFVFASAAALMAVSNTASAQTLNWYGINGCFSNSLFSFVGSGGYTSVDNNCTVSQNTADVVWGEKNNPSDRSSLAFTRSNPPGGPGGSPTALTFGGVGTYAYLHLGNVNYFNGQINTNPYALLSSTNLGFAFFFNSGTTADLNYTSQLLATNNENGGTDNIAFTGGSVATFSVGGYDYEFSVTGLDQQSYGYGYHGGGSVCDASIADALPSTLSASEGHSDSGELCGKIKYVGATSGNNGNAVVTPEPSTYLLMAAGMAGIAAVTRRRRQVKA
jgi:hypothetical protein